MTTTEGQARRDSHAWKNQESLKQQASSYRSETSGMLSSTKAIVAGQNIYREISTSTLAVQEIQEEGSDECSLTITQVNPCVIPELNITIAQ